MVWGKDRCGAACVRGQLYFRRMRVIRTEKMLIENADMIVCANNTQTEPDLRCLGALLGRARPPPGLARAAAGRPNCSIWPAGF